MMNIIRTEPARVVATVIAVIGVLSAFGLGVSDDQSAAIVAAVGAVLALVGGETVRAQVTPVATLRDGAYNVTTVEQGDGSRLDSFDVPPPSTSTRGTDFDD